MQTVVRQFASLSYSFSLFVFSLWSEKSFDEQICASICFKHILQLSELNRSVLSIHSTGHKKMSMPRASDDVSTAKPSDDFGSFHLCRIWSRILIHIRAAIRLWLFCQLDRISHETWKRNGRVRDQNRLFCYAILNLNILWCMFGIKVLIEIFMSIARFLCIT